MDKLPKSFYLQENVVDVAQKLIGKILCTRIRNQTVKSVITETEAYAGVEDKASHAYNGKRTQRNEIMYAEGGKSYVYLCYGIHYLFNVVTNVKDVPHAVLIRAVYPIENISLVCKRRNTKKLVKNLTTGPGKVTQALGIDIKHNGVDLLGNTIWIEDRGLNLNKYIQTGKRIGIDYAAEHADLPYRFWVNWDSAKKVLYNS
jgi:DNA-3-methyladenine glycosylase